jgi:hypothetical protein
MLYRLWITATLVAGLTASQHKAKNSETDCRPIDAFSTGLREYLVQLDTSSDSSDIDQRVGFQLPSVPISSIVIQTDSISCSRAATAYYARLTSPPANRAVALIRMGSVFIVVDPRVKIGEFTGHAVFDSTFTINLSNFAG